MRRWVPVVTLFLSFGLMIYELTRPEPILVVFWLAIITFALSAVAVTDDIDEW